MATKVFLRQYFGMFQRTDLLLLITRYPLIVSPNLGNPQIVSLAKENRFNITVACTKGYTTAVVEKLMRNHIVLENSRTRRKYETQVLSIHPHPAAKSSYLYNLTRRNVFGPRNQFFDVTVAVPLITIRPPRKFEIFNLTYYNPNKNPHTVYHALCITNQDWVNFDFLQLSDLHVAKRNDYIFDTIMAKKFAGVNSKRDISKLFEEKDPQVFTDPKYRTLLELIEFRGRANNFNTALKQVIIHANSLAKQGKLDFIIITGDLVDFVRISGAPPAMFEERTNFQVLHQILVGNAGAPPLLVPCFVIPGNHDFRVHNYQLLGVTPFDIAPEYKPFGLTRGEAALYKSTRVWNALATSVNSLNDYYRFFNPKLDYFKQFGQFHFLFFNSGPDIFFRDNSFVDFIGGDPGTVGLHHTQVEWLRRYMEKKVQPADKVCLALHAPVINFAREYDIHDILVTTRTRRGATPWISDHRMDIGTIYGNRNALLLAILGQNQQQPIDLVITGHVHRPAEYHVEFSGIENPERMQDNYRIYCDHYSEQLAACGGDPAQVKDFWKQNRPLLLTTCAVGPKDTHVREGQVPGYRQFTVRAGEIVDVSPQFRHHDPYILLSRHRNVKLEVPWRSELRKNWQDFSGKIDADISNPDGITESLTYFEVDFHFRGRGVKDFIVKPHIKVIKPFKRRKILQSPVLGETKNHYKRYYVLENVQRFIWVFTGKCQYAGRRLPALASIYLTVRMISAVRKEGTWHVIGDEEVLNKVGLKSPVS
ncbi:MAG TPA: metallophosphoesterase [Candidatus Lokiarchaeia archaeon]|nr:metallophosphoesterase [Candidatus Lokiarchaeia archaeon]